jgi:hypothetical protein
MEPRNRGPCRHFPAAARKSAPFPLPRRPLRVFLSAFSMTTPSRPWRFDENGDPVEVPTACAGWQIRHWTPGARGRGRLVRDASGTPLPLPAHASAETFDELVQRRPGRYVLTAIDKDGKRIRRARDCEIVVDEPARATAPTMSAELPRLVALVEELVQVTKELALTQRRSVDEQRRIANALEALRVTTGAGPVPQPSSPTPAPPTPAASSAPAPASPGDAPAATLDAYVEAVATLLSPDESALLLRVLDVARDDKRTRRWLRQLFRDVDVTVGAARFRESLSEADAIAAGASKLQ